MEHARSIYAKRPIVADLRGSPQEGLQLQAVVFLFHNDFGSLDLIRHDNPNISPVPSLQLILQGLPAFCCLNQDLHFRPTALPKVSMSNLPVLSCKASNLSPRSATFVILSCIVSIVSSICDWIAWIYNVYVVSQIFPGRCHTLDHQDSMFWALEARGRGANTHLLTLGIVAARRRASWGLGTRGDVWVVRFRRPKFDISAHDRRERFVLQPCDWVQYAYMIEV